MYVEMADEVAAALNGWGTDVFRRYLARGW